MKELIILVPNGEAGNLSSIVGPYKIFTRANDIWKAKTNHPIFRINLVGSKREVDFYEGLFSVKVQKQLSEIKKADLILIPSLNHNYDQAVKDNKEMMEWIKCQYLEGAEVASICTGAFLLAATGLLDGKTCSTHYSAALDFAKRFPAVRLATDQIITDENGIYTNGGAYSFLNLIIYLIEKYYDRQVAILCAKIFQVEMDRERQSIFSIFKGQKNHEDAAILEAQQYIEGHYADSISIAALSKRLAIGRRNFDRRFIKATGNRPIEYLQRVRIESAKKALESTDKHITEVMYEVGYADQKAFREVFRKVTGLSPIDYKHRYNKEAAL